MQQGTDPQWVALLLPPPPTHGSFTWTGEAWDCVSPPLHAAIPLHSAAWAVLGTAMAFTGPPGLQATTSYLNSAQHSGTPTASRAALGSGQRAHSMMPPASIHTGHGQCQCQREAGKHQGAGSVVRRGSSSAPWVSAGFNSSCCRALRANPGYGNAGSKARIALRKVHVHPIPQGNCVIPALWLHSASSRAPLGWCHLCTALALGQCGAHASLLPLAAPGLGTHPNPLHATELCCSRDMVFPGTCDQGQ